MKNYVKQGDTMTLVAPYAVVSGGGFLVGAIFAVAQSAAASGEEVEGVRNGLFGDMPAVSGETASPGAKVYWDNTNKRFTTTASGNVLVGAFAATKASGDTVCTVLLDGVIR